MAHSLKVHTITLLALCALSMQAQELPLRLVTAIPMPGFTGDFDHFGVDLTRNRLFLAAEEHKTVEVFDLRNGKRLQSIEGFGQPLMMVYLPEKDQLLVTDGGDSAVHLVDCKDYKIIKTIKLGKGVDHGVFNPVNQYYYVENGGASGAPTHVLSIIDTKSLNTSATLRDCPGARTKEWSSTPLAKSYT